MDDDRRHQATRPLSYESLKVVLQYMKPDERFEIARRLPDIRKTEKVVPLKIDSLCFGEMWMTVNDTFYRVGVVRKFHEGCTIPEKVDWANNGGGVPYDLDCHGFHDKSMDTVITPGDIQLVTPEPLPPPKTREELQLRLDELRKGDELDSRRAHTFWTPSRTPHEILLLDCLLRDIPLPYDSFIQLKIVTLGGDGLTRSDDESENDGSSDSKDGSEESEYKLFNREIVQQVPYTFKLHEAFKSLTTNLFGNRSEPIQVKELFFDRSEVDFKMRILRLPPGLKLQVDELSLDEEIPLTLTQLTPILHESSFPLRCLEVIYPDGPEQLQHPIIQNNLQKLILHTDSFIDNQQLFCVHKNIHLGSGNPTFNYIQLIKHWIKLRREIGSCITGTYYEEEYAMKVLETVKAGGFEFRKQEERMLLIPSNGWSQIRMTVEEAKESGEGHKDGWNVKLEVVGIHPV